MTPLIRSITAIFQKLLLNIHRCPVIWLSILVTIIGFSALGLRYSKLELDIYDVHDPDFQSSIDLSEMKSFYNDRSQMLVAFHFPSTPFAHQVCSLLRWSQKLSHYKEVKSVTSLWTIRMPRVREQKVWYPKSLEDPCSLSPFVRIDLNSKTLGGFFRHLVSSHGATDLVFDISFSGTESDTAQVQYIIDETQKFVSKELPEVQTDYLGMASFRYYFKKIMLRDSIYNLVIVLIIIMFLRLVYGTWRSGFYLSLTLVGSNLILYGAMGWAGIPIDILTNNLFLMTAVAGTADFIFVSQHQLKGDYHGSLRELITPAFFTTLTTIIGFLSLNSSELDIIKRFGTGAAIGALAEWIMLFMFLPAMLKVLKWEKVWVNADKAMKIPFLNRLQKIVMPRILLVTCVILMILSFPSFYYLNDQDSPVENLPKDHVLRQAYERFQETFLWQGQVYLYFPESPELDLQASITDRLAELPLVYRVEDPEELAEEWAKGLPPLRQDLIRRELSMTPLWGRYHSDAGTLRIPLYLKKQDLHSLRELREEVEKLCRGKCRLAGQRVVYLEYGEKISKTMIESFGVSILLIVAILGILLWMNGSLKTFPAVVLSSLMGPLVMLTLIAIFQVPVTLITSIFLAVMVGLAGDNAIQYTMATGSNLEEGIKSREEASIIVTLVMIFGSFMFTLQTLLPMKILGILFITGFTINLAGDLLGLKGLLTKKSD